MTMRKDMRACVDECLRCYQTRSRMRRNTDRAAFVAALNENISLLNERPSKKSHDNSCHSSFCRT